MDQDQSWPQNLFFSFFFNSIFAPKKKMECRKLYPEEIFQLCLFSIKAEKAGFSVTFFPPARPLCSAMWPRDPFPSVQFTLLCCSSSNLGYVLESVGKQQKEK